MSRSAVVRSKRVGRSSTKSRSKLGGKRTLIVRKAGTLRADDINTPVDSALSGGRPIFRDAGRGRRTEGFYAPDTGPLSSIIANGMELRRRSRALMRQNAWARNAKRTLVANAIGRGVRPKFRYEPDGWGRTTRDLWDECGPFFDANGLVDFGGLQALVLDEVFEAGEIFVRRRARFSQDDLPVPLQLQLLESEHVPYWYTMPLPDGGWIKAGIEFDPIGRRRAYWLYQHHPGEFATSFSFDGYSLKRVPADQMLHIFIPERAESVRGIPHLTRSLLRLWGLEEYDDAELEKVRFAASVGGTIELLDPDKASDKVGVLHKKALGERGGGPFTEVEPGTVTVLGPGEAFKAFPPAEGAGNYGPFHDHHLRAVAADCGLTYEMITGDLSKSSYVSLRFGSLEFRRRCELLRSVLDFQFNRAVLSWWMDIAVQSGELSAPGYEDNKQRRAYQNVLWVAPAWDYVQPDKEVGALTEACRSGFTTIDRVVAQREGEDGATLAEEIAAINARNDRLGLILDSDPRHVAKPATGKSAQSEETQASTADNSESGQATDNADADKEATGTEGR